MHARLLISSALAALLVAGSLPADDVEKVEVKDVKVGAITLKAPANWKQSKPTSSLRLAQFSIPAAEGDEEGAELAIFAFAAGGSVKDNVNRWIGQFYAEERKTKLTAGNAPDGKYVFVEISGTYKKPIGPLRLRKTEPMKNARMLGVILAVEGKGNYFLKMTGPDKTVTAAAAPFRDSFGANGKEEQALELE